MDLRFSPSFHIAAFKLPLYADTGFGQEPVPGRAVLRPTRPEAVSAFGSCRRHPAIRSDVERACARLTGGARLFKWH